MENQRYVIGIDGGGTKCAAVLANESGKDIARMMGGPANLQQGGMEKTVAAVQEVVDKLIASAGIDSSRVAAIVAGLAGAGRKDSRDEVEAKLKAIYPNILVVVRTDADVALEGAFTGEPGIVLIAGTGSICFGRNQAGQTARAGGWGHLLGDEGGATWIALEALKAALQVQDGRLPAGELKNVLANTLGEQDITQVVVKIYRGKISVSKMASLAKVVFDLSEDDHVARQIVLRAARELGRLVVAVARKLQMENNTIKVALVGGIFNNKKKLIAPLRDEITRVCPDVAFLDPAMDPAMGAVHIAQRALITASA